MPEQVSGNARCPVRVRCPGESRVIAEFVLARVAESCPSATWHPVRARCHVRARGETRPARPADRHTRVPSWSARPPHGPRVPLTMSRPGLHGRRVVPCRSCQHIACIPVVPCRSLSCPAARVTPLRAAAPAALIRAAPRFVHHLLRPRSVYNLLLPRCCVLHLPARCSHARRCAGAL